MSETDLQAVMQALRSGHNILIVSHVRPDGDAVGSVLGLGLTLRAAGKQVQMVLEDGVPYSFRHLPGAGEIRHHPDGEFDCTIVVDCSDLLRTGSSLDGLGRPDVNIDHHPTNEYFAALNLVDDEACSTTEILYRLLTFSRVPIPGEAAAALLTGLITDTIGFQTSNITASALRTSADLVDRGLNMSELYRKALVEKTFTALKYWGTGLETLQRENGLIWTTLSLADRSRVSYRGRDDADLINQLSSVRGSKVRLIFIEQSESEVKVSWRSQPGYDVSGIAGQFGGGGHRTAAGATIYGSLEEVQDRVLEATRGLMNSVGNPPHRGWKDRKNRVG